MTSVRSAASKLSVVVPGRFGSVVGPSRVDVAIVFGG